MREQDEKLVEEMVELFWKTELGDDEDDDVRVVIREAITRTRKEYEDEIAKKDAEIRRLTAMVARRDAGFKQGTRFGRVV